MKAVSMENQASMLSMANKMLKLRIMRLENVGAALKEGVKKIQAGHCDCDLTVNLVRQTSRDYIDKDPMSGKTLPSFELISKSRAIRDQNVESVHMPSSSTSGNHAMGASSSEDDLVSTPPVIESIRQPMLLPKPPPQRCYKTALDVINETIVKTLDSPQPSDSNQVALNLVKQPSRPLILVAPSPRPSVDSLVSSNGDGCSSPMVKLEQTEVEPRPEVDSSTMTVLNKICIANPDGTSLCRGDMLNLNKLTSYLDMITRKVVGDDGASAMERAIIKSRMKIPFWTSDDTALYICGAHRNSIVHGVDLNICALCNKKRNGKKPRLSPMHMYTITFSMSLEYYTCNGIILPIGLAVCGICRDKHLRSVDLSNSRIIPPNSPEIYIPDSNSHSNLPTKREPTSPTSELMLTACPPKMRQLSTSSSKVTSTNGDVQVQLVAMSPPPDRIRDAIKSVVPVSSSQNGPNIFSKIANLNDALQAINPRYQPIGFSITSMESCSRSVMEDAVLAAETAVFTIMSVIAPGQESHLWEAIRPNLDKKLCKNK